MKRFTKGICLLLILATLLPTSALAAVPEDTVGTNSLFFVNYSTYCWQIADDQFEVWFDVSAQRAMDKLGAQRIIIQKSSDGENWINVMTFLSSYYEYLLGANRGYYSGHVTYKGVQGCYYRAYVTFYAEDSVGIGKVSAHTYPIYLGS